MDYMHVPASQDNPRIFRTTFHIEKNEQKLAGKWLTDEVVAYFTLELAG